MGEFLKNRFAQHPMQTCFSGNSPWAELLLFFYLIYWWFKTVTDSPLGDQILGF